MATTWIDPSRVHEHSLLLIIFQLTPNDPMLSKSTITICGIISAQAFHEQPNPHQIKLEGFR